MILINFQVIYIIKQRDGWNFTDTRGIAKVEVFFNGEISSIWSAADSKVVRTKDWFEGAH